MSHMITEHRVRIDMQDDEDNRYIWECECGRAGSGGGGYLRATVKSDEHIDYDGGDTRVDVHSGQRP